MKNANLIAMFLLTVALAAGTTGCKHRPINTTNIPDNGGPPSNSGQTPGAGVGDGKPNGITSEPIPTENGPYTGLFAGPHTEDTEKFKADTIYFDFDSATIKPAEEAKLQEVASYFKNNTKVEGLIILGNSDKAATE